MKTKNKALLLSLCAVLLVAATVLCTIAWLTAEQTVTNTFTYGKVAIELKEPKTDAFGEYYYRDDTTTEESCDPESYFYYEVKAVTENSYTLRPAHEYIKHPYIEIREGSEPCYLFVKIENELAAIEADEEGYDTIEEQMFTRGWKKVDGHTGVYVYCGAPERDYSTGTSVYKELGDRCIATRSGGNGGRPYYDVFSTFKVKGDVDSETLAKYNNAQIKITAYAVQADGFEDTKKITDAKLWETAFPTAAAAESSSESSAESSDADPTI